MKASVQVPSSETTQAVTVELVGEAKAGKGLHVQTANRGLALGSRQVWHHAVAGLSRGPGKAEGAPVQRARARAPSG